MNSQRIWLSYDLGVGGDYDGLYCWLDEHEAKECGDNLATLKFDYELDLVTDIQNELSESVEITKKDRFYMIFRDDNDQVRGKFLFNIKRKRAPWLGLSELIDVEYDI